MAGYAPLGVVGLLEPPRAALLNRGTANKKTGAVSRAASRVHPACARMKMPIPGKPEIGAHFVSFNFANTLISALVSSAVCGAQCRES
jgi:hypothetical protein